MKQIDFSNLKEKYEILLSVIDKANQIRPLTSIVKQDIHEIKDWIKRLKQPKFYVVFTGTFNAGKSTMINAFLGRLVLPLSNQPWTAKATTIQKSNDETESFMVVNKDGSSQIYPDIDDLLNFVSNQKPENLTNIAGVNVFLRDLPFDHDIVLVDTPGFDVANEDHKKVTQDFTRKAHACIVCFDIGLIDSSDQNSLVQYLSSNKALTAERRFWTINKWDTKSSEQQFQGESSFYNLLKRNKLNDSLSRLYKVSAGTFLAGELSSKNNLTQEEKKFVKEINLDRYKYTNEVKEGFKKFRDAIVDFLQKNAKRDFYLKAKQEFSSTLLHGSW